MKKPKPPRKRYPMISFRLTDQREALLKRLAKGERTTPGKLAKQWVDVFLDRNEPPNRGVRG